MLATKRSASVTPEVNLRNSLHTVDRQSMQVRESFLALKPRADITSAVQNRVISGPTKRTCVLQFKKNYFYSLMPVFVNFIFTGRGFLRSWGGTPKCSTERNRRAVWYGR